MQSWFIVLSEKFSSLYPVSTGNLSSPIQQNMQRIYSTEEQPQNKDGQGDKPKQSLTAEVLTHSQFYSRQLVRDGKLPLQVKQ